MRLFEEFKLYESMWDDPVSEEVTAEYDEAEVKACLDRVNSAASSTKPGFDDKYGDGMIFVSVSEEQLKKALRIGNRGTFQDDAVRATTVPAQAVDDMVISFNFYEDDETAAVSLMLGGEDDTYYDDICVVGWGDHIAGLSDIKDMDSAKTFFETQLIPNANKIAEDIINNSWAHYQLSDYAGITSTKASTTESGCKGAECKNDLKEEVGYRVVLADYDTDDFDINVEFGMQDPDENEVVDHEYLLKPGQTKGDLVVWLSRDCGYTSIYVHDERPATSDDIKRLTSDTFSVTGTKDEWQDYGSLDEALTESDDPYGYGPYKKFSDPDLEVGDYVLTTRPFSRGGRTYPARITSISSKWIEYEISGFGFTDKGTKARPGSASDSAIRKAAAHLGV